MAISLILLANKRAPEPQLSTASSRYGYGTTGGQRWLSAGISVGIAGAVGAALIGALVAPQIRTRIEGPITATQVPPPRPIDPIVEPVQPQPTMPNPTVITIPRPQIDFPALGNPPAGDLDIGLIPPPGPFTGDGPGGVGTGETGIVDPPPTPIFRDARRDPRYAGSFQPAYPPALEREGVMGTARVRVRIATNGRVINVENLGATDPAFFAATERQAMRHWRFVPAISDGVHVESEQILTVRFEVPARD